MIQSEPIGLWNTGFPLVLLGVLAVLFPRLLVRRGTRSQGEVFVAVWASAGLLLVAGAGVFAAVYGARGAPVGAAFGAAPLSASWFFLKLSGFAAMLWGPVLVLVWLGLAQGVEKRKGEDAARDG